jgi:hypothetical protein
MKVSIATTSPTLNAQKRFILPIKNSGAIQDSRVGEKAPTLGQPLLRFVPSKSAAPSVKQKQPGVYSGGGGYLRSNHDPVYKI